MRVNAPLSRQGGSRGYKKIFYIVPEGAVTEKSYFENLDRNRLINRDACQLTYVCPKRSSQNSIASLIKKARSNTLRQNDEIWIVLDEDSESHKQDQWASLSEWKCKNNNHYLAISTPYFEHWILLHFNNTPAQSTTKMKKQLLGHLVGYRKDLAPYCKRFTSEAVQGAITEAKKRFHGQNTCPTQQLSDGVHELVSRICCFSQSQSRNSN